MRKKDKNFAGVLALFFGWLGVHRYYLGESRKGLPYTLGAGFIMFAGRFGAWLKILWVPIILLICLIDAITLFAMDQKRFDEKYNSPPSDANRPETDFERSRQREQLRKQAREQVRERVREKRQQRHEARRNRRGQGKPTPPKRTSRRHNPHKKSGIAKFNDYDYLGAIEDFKKSLEIVPDDIATHFNLACTYSLTESAEQSFYHLDKAVKLGFRDFQKIKEHHALAYLRIQDGFDDFEENGFRLPRPVPTAEEPADDLLNTKPDLLDQLNKLGELRNKGLLTEVEFEQQKKKLLG